jgi:hypothetical protein
MGVVAADVPREPALEIPKFVPRFEPEGKKTRWVEVLTEKVRAWEEDDHQAFEEEHGKLGRCQRPALVRNDFKK